MKVFEHPNTSSGWKCPICHTDNDSPITLIPIYGTESGNNIQAKQVHVKCIELAIYKNHLVVLADLGVNYGQSMEKV